MKIRMGWVSNSSSSSFVVSFHTNPKTAAEVREQMFGKQKYHDGHDTMAIAEDVFRQMQNGTAKKEDVFRSIHGGYFSPYKGLPGYFDTWEITRGLEYGSVAYQEAQAKGDDFNNKHANAIVEKFMKENDGRTLYVFSYADEDGEWGSMMEHSGIFDNLPHIQTSYH